jgi:hypothetical protein
MTDVFFPGPIHVAYSPFDPFDIGEPRTFSEDDVTFLTVPSWGEMDRLATVELAARALCELRTDKWTDDHNAALAALRAALGEDR